MASALRLARRAGPVWTVTRCVSSSPAREDLPVDRWGLFCDRWNATLGRRPTAMLIFFGGASTLTYAMILASISCSSVLRAALAAPEFAVGLLVMMVTRRLRVPLNLALAAPLSAAFPALSKFKISPLLTAFAVSKEDQEALRSQFDQSNISDAAKDRVRAGVRRLVQFGRFVEGPVDKYGLSYFVVSKATGASTLCGATHLSSVGLDVPGALAAWGFSGDLQEDGGILAAACLLNVPCAPLHFLGALGAVGHLERAASSMWHAREDEIRRSLRKDDATSETRAPGDESQEPDITEEDVRTNLVTNIALITVILDLAFMLYMFRRMSKSALGTVPDESDGLLARVRRVLSPLPPLPESSDPPLHVQGAPPVDREAEPLTAGATSDAPVVSPAHASGCSGSFSVDAT